MIGALAEAAADRVMQVTQTAGRADEHAAPHVRAGASNATRRRSLRTGWFAGTASLNVATGVHADPAKCVLPVLSEFPKWYHGFRRDREDNLNMVA